MENALQEINKVCKDGAISDADCETAVEVIENESKEIIKLFLDHGADVNVTTVYFFPFTLFGYACRVSTLDIVKMMINYYGADLSLQDEHGRLPIKLALEQAYRSGREDITDFFLDMANAENINTWHYLHLYVGEIKNPSKKVISRLLKLGADVNATDENGYTVLNHACLSRNTKILKYLIKNGADVNGYNEQDEDDVELSDGGSELFFAVMNGNIEIVKILLENGADPNRYRYSRSPLIKASHSKEPYSIEMIELLLKFGADITNVTTTGPHLLMLLLQKMKKLSNCY